MKTEVIKLALFIYKVMEQKELSEYKAQDISKILAMGILYFDLIYTWP